MGEFALGSDLVTQDALGCGGQLVFGGLAVNQVLRAAGILGGGIGPGAIALFAHDEEQAEVAHSAASRRSPATIIEAMMPLASVEPRPQIRASSSLEAKNGGTVVHVSGERNHRLAPLSKDVETIPFNRAALDAPRSPRGQSREIGDEVFAHGGFVVGDGLDVHQSSA